MASYTLKDKTTKLTKQYSFSNRLIVSNIAFVYFDHTPNKILFFVFLQDFEKLGKNEQIFKKKCTNV